MATNALLTPKLRRPAQLNHIYRPSSKSLFMRLVGAIAEGAPTLEPTPPRPTRVHSVMHTDAPFDHFAKVNSLQTRIVGVRGRLTHVWATQSLGTSTVQAAQ